MKVLMLVVLLTAAGTVNAEARVQWGKPDNARLLELASALEARDELPDQLTRLSLETSISVEENIVRRRVRDVWYYSSFSDVQNNGMDRIYFDEQTDSVVIHTAASVDRRGRLHTFDRQTLKITDVNRDETFTDTRQAVIALPGLEAGSIAMVEYEIVQDRAKLAMGWSERIFTQAMAPIDQLTISVQWPVNEEVQWATDGDWVNCEAGDQILLCRGEAIPKPEKAGHLNWHDDVGQIVVAERQTWDQVIGRSTAAFEQALKDTRGSDSLLEELDLSALSKQDQIARIHEFVAQDIRYVSMSELGHAITPHSVAAVLMSRYGDCKDKSAVLYHLLHRIGVKAFPVLVATDRSSLQKLRVPSMGYFDHMVVCFDWQGRTHCLDATDAYTDWQHTPTWIQGKVALDLRRGAQPSTIDAERFRWKVSVETNTDFTPDGGALESQKRIYHGGYAGTVRNYLASMNSSERQTWALKDYQQQVSDSVAPAFEFVGIDVLAPELTIRSRVDYQSIVDVGEPLSYVEQSAWLRQEISSLYPGQTDRDEQFPGLHVTTLHQYDLGRIWQLTRPTADFDFYHSFGSMTRRVEQLHSGRLLVKTELKIPRQEVKQGSVELFNQFLDILVHESDIRFAGKPL